MKDTGKSSLGIEANIAALLSYVGGFVTGIIIFVLEKNNRFVKFHAMQSIIVFGTLTVLQTGAGVLPFLKFATSLFSIAGLVLWIILMLKAYQGEMFKIPVAGELAEKQLPADTSEPEDKNS